MTKQAIQLAQDLCIDRMQPDLGNGKVAYCMLLAQHPAMVFIGKTMGNF